jgi:hypothetical protein
LAYLAPDYTTQNDGRSPGETLHVRSRPVTSGWAAPFVIYPSIPGALDLPLLIHAIAAARASGLGIWASAETLLPYEYRAMEKLYRITRKKVNNARLDIGEEHFWRERYCVDMRTRTLHGPEDYFGI